jgi:hypothetical protein
MSSESVMTRYLGAPFHAAFNNQKNHFGILCKLPGAVC